MKYIKKYESINIGTPKKGDYVICEESNLNLPTEFRSFISNNIGQLNNIDEYSNVYKVHYDNIPIEFINRFDDDSEREMFLKEIKNWSEDKHDLETIFSVKKYNL